MSMVTCKNCNSGTMNKQRVYRLSPIVVLIGWILLISSFIAVGLLGLLILIGLLSEPYVAPDNSEEALAEFALGLGVWACLGGSAIVNGLLGGLLVMKKSVLKCNNLNCEAIVVTS